MKARDYYALLGLAAPVVAYIFIGVAIAQSPWFRWDGNALSDLGHSSWSSVAPVFNFGLLFTGFLIVAYALLSLRHSARWTSLALAVAAFSLQLVGAFNEVYGVLHYAVSILFFVSMGVASLVYAAVRRSYLGVAAFAIGLAAWVLYWLDIYSSGVAVPEAVSTLAVMPWVMSTALRIYRGK
ncbi:DUF998 domain-containing protein [Candidatus Bathyarchaeota archaeon]|nr:DUF998 domain-containing protein [Candidatus Bathyarchaeota archaeon]